MIRSECAEYALGGLRHGVRQRVVFLCDIEVFAHDVTLSRKASRCQDTFQREAIPRHPAIRNF
jgi:hypothetical protein